MVPATARMDLHAPNDEEEAAMGVLPIVGRPSRRCVNNHCEMVKDEIGRVAAGRPGDDGDDELLGAGLRPFSDELANQLSDALTTLNSTCRPRSRPGWVGAGPVEVGVFARRSGSVGEARDRRVGRHVRRGLRPRCRRGPGQHDDHRKLPGGGLLAVYHSARDHSSAVPVQLRACAPTNQVFE